MRFLLFIFLSFISSNIYSALPSEKDLQADYSIVFVHIGDSLPSHFISSALQARLFNKCPIYIILNEKALNNYDSSLISNDIIPITCESLSKSDNHKLFIKNSRLEKNFWNKATERFFYLYDFIKKYNLNNIFHMENDVMIYTDLEKMLPIFEKNYKNMIAATFDNDNRCIPGFLYIGKDIPLLELNKFIAKQVIHGGNDMIFLAKFKNIYRNKFIDHLPILTSNYVYENALKSTIGATTKQKHLYCNYFDQFNSIFDAAALGQYLGGIDPIHTKSNSIGFINESALFRPDSFSFEWEQDEKGRLVPFIIYKNEKYPINNLHIHSKNTKGFYSLRHLCL
jgi:hypothetical protein